MPREELLSPSYKRKRTIKRVLIVVSVIAAVTVTPALVIYQKRQQNRATVSVTQTATPTPVAVSKPYENPGAPALDLTINELWTQRSEDNRYRAKQRLDAKIIRVTGPVEDISERSCSITGPSSPAGPVSVSVVLNDIYANKIQEGLVFVERGTQISVQGRFSFDRMWLSDAVFVDRATGRALMADDLKRFSKSGGLNSEPVPNKAARP